MAALARAERSFLEAVFYVRANTRAYRILKALATARRRRMYTVELLMVALGRVNNHDHQLLKRLESFGLIRRYPGHLYEDEGERGPRVVWNELTPLGRRVLEIVENMLGKNEG